MPLLLVPNKKNGESKGHRWHFSSLGHIKIAMHWGHGLRPVSCEVSML